MMPHITSADGTPMSRFCFGTMQFGGPADETASRAMFDACRAAGITFFDTAFVYTGGASETLLGEFAASERDSLIIATKAAYEGGSSAHNILTGFEISRGRLGMDYIDILYLHRWDADVPLEETFGALAGLKSAGKIGHIGVSNFSAWQGMKAQAVAGKLGVRIDIMQPMYNLVKRQAEVELLPMALSEGIAVAPYSPLGGGLLTGKYNNGGAGRLAEDGRYAARYGPGWMHDAARNLADLAAETGIHPATLAVAWVARNPAITAPIISARTADQLKPSLDALALTFDDTLYAQITALTPTPAPATDRLEEA
ncbi:aldo/keto reductase [Pseudogemmobacter sp. W21_MBD1_M6]|uniref:aldo/keto reductase n=1 Tax=Pseudogemmobacter sp. W21_MBD1_M6 TaxID=3240271 RepID=UPI003F9C39FD